jgi:hypothetical protein
MWAAAGDTCDVRRALVRAQRQAASATAPWAVELVQSAYHRTHFGAQRIELSTHLALALCEACGVLLALLLAPVALAPDEVVREVFPYLGHQIGRQTHRPVVREGAVQLERLLHRRRLYQHALQVSIRRVELTCEAHTRSFVRHRRHRGLSVAARSTRSRSQRRQHRAAAAARRLPPLEHGDAYVRARPYRPRAS